MNDKCRKCEMSNKFKTMWIQFDDVVMDMLKVQINDAFQFVCIVAFLVTVRFQTHALATRDIERKTINQMCTSNFMLQLMLNQISKELSHDYFYK